MPESASRGLHFAGAGDALLLIEKKRVLCWDFQSHSLRCEIAGELAGVSKNGHVLLVKSEQIPHFYNILDGRELDRARIGVDEFAESQCVIINGKPNDGECLVENVLTGQTKLIPLEGKLTFNKPSRLFPTDYVIVHTWRDDGCGEGENLECFSLVTGQQIMSVATNGSCPYHWAASWDQSLLGVEECGRIRVYDLVTRRLIYEIKRATPMNLGYRIRRTASGEYQEFFNDYGEVVSNLRNISAISLHPTTPQIISVATGDQVLLIDMNHKVHDVFRNWSSGEVIRSFQAPDPIQAIAFEASGKLIVGVTSKDQLLVYDIAGNS